MSYNKPEVVTPIAPAINLIYGSTSGVKTSSFQDGISGQPDLATSIAYVARASISTLFPYTTLFRSSMEHNTAGASRNLAVRHIPAHFALMKATNSVTGRFPSWLVGRGSIWPKDAHGIQPERVGC